MRTTPIRTRSDERTRAAGCPSVLATDVSHNDVVDPVVEWPPAPPTRSSDGDGRADRVDGSDDGSTNRPASEHADVTTARLAADRGRQLLEVAVEHLRTVLETSPDQETSARVEHAIRDVSVACERLDAAQR